MKTTVSKRTVLALILTFILAFSSVITSFAAKGEWKQDSTGWWYCYSGGSYPKSQWEEIDSKWYYFDETGYMASGEYRDGYWLGADGAWNPSYKGGRWASNKTGKWYTDNSGWYPVSCWLKIDGKWYYFENTGYMAADKWIGDCYVDEKGIWQPDAAKVDYTGTYVEPKAGRCIITVEKFSSEENKKYYTIKVRWSGSATETSEWNISGAFDSKGEMKYTDGTKTIYTYNTSGGYTVTPIFTKLTGTIKIKDGKLTWIDDKENVAKDNEFILKKAPKVTGKNYAGTYADTKSGRAYFEITLTDDDYYTVRLRWSGSASTYAEWCFEGKFDKDGVLKYDNCYKNEVTFTSDGKGNAEMIYKNGIGSIKINDKGELTWDNKNENIAEGLVFKLDK